MCEVRLFVRLVLSARPFVIVMVCRCVGIIFESVVTKLLVKNRFVRNFSRDVISLNIAFCVMLHDIRKGNSVFNMNSHEPRNTSPRLYLIFVF